MTTTTRDLVARLHTNPDDHEAKAALSASLIREGYGADVIRFAVFNAHMSVALLYGHGVQMGGASGRSEEAVVGISQHIAQWLDALGLDDFLGEQSRADAEGYREAAQEADKRFKDRRRPASGTYAADHADALRAARRRMNARTKDGGGEDGGS